MDKHTPALQHVAVSENGELRWMTGRKPRECELYAMPDGGRLSPLYAAAPELLEAAEIALSYIEAVCFNTPNEKKRRNYADAASKIRAALAKARGDAVRDPDDFVECQACYGKGFNDVERQVAERKSDVQTFRETCDACEGTGKVNAGGVA